MINNKLSVTIGIPAYNEEANIAYLLKSLLKQKEINFVVKEIIVISDGSTDNTVLAASTVKSPLINVVDLKVRQGVNNSQNKIIKLTKEDILVIVNGDVIPRGNHFIQNLILPLLEDKAVGLVGSDVINARPKKLFEKIIADSYSLKKSIYAQINKGNNIYECPGQARAFSKAFYSNIFWPDDCPEDAFSYLICIKKGFKFIYTEKAKVTFRLPQNFNDHANQTLRFVDGKKKLVKYFSSDFLTQEYNIPFSLLLKTIAKYIAKKPLTTLVYLLINSYLWFISPKKPIDQSKWDISVSSKRII